MNSTFQIATVASVYPVSAIAASTRSSPEEHGDGTFADALHDARAVGDPEQSGSAVVAIARAVDRNAETGTPTKDVALAPGQSPVVDAEIDGGKRAAAAFSNASDVATGSTEDTRVAMLHVSPEMGASSNESAKTDEGAPAGGSAPAKKITPLQDGANASSKTAGAAAANLPEKAQPVPSGIVLPTPSGDAMHAATEKPAGTTGATEACSGEADAPADRIGLQKGTSIAAGSTESTAAADLSPASQQVANLTGESPAKSAGGGATAVRVATLGQGAPTANRSLGKEKLADIKVSAKTAKTAIKPAHPGAQNPSAPAIQTSTAATAEALDAGAGVSASMLAGNTGGLPDGIENSVFLTGQSTAVQNAVGQNTAGQSTRDASQAASAESMDPASVGPAGAGLASQAAPRVNGARPSKTDDATGAAVTGAAATGEGGASVGPERSALSHAGFTTTVAAATSGIGGHGASVTLGAASTPMTAISATHGSPAVNFSPSTGAAGIEMAGDVQPSTTSGRVGTLEVGFHDTTLGWLSVRASVDNAGDLHAALAGRSAAATTAVDGMLPALGRFLQEQNVAVQSVSNAPMASAIARDAAVQTGSGGASLLGQHSQQGQTQQGQSQRGQGQPGHGSQGQSQQGSTQPIARAEVGADRRTVEDSRTPWRLHTERVGGGGQVPASAHVDAGPMSSVSVRI